MREESHLDDMRSAIRGDFERLAERRGTQELMHARVPPAEPASEVISEAEVDTAEAVAPDGAGRSWLVRLFSR